MFGSSISTNDPNVSMDSVSNVRSSKSSMLARFTASKSTECNALFLFTFRTMFVPVKIW